MVTWTVRLLQICTEVPPPSVAALATKIALVQFLRQLLRFFKSHAGFSILLVLGFWLIRQYRYVP